MRRPIDTASCCRTANEPRLESQPGSWLTVETRGIVALDPARWAQRDQQFAVWALIETWHRRRRLH